MTAEDNAFRELLDDYIVECLPLAERAADALVELERRWRDGEDGDDLLQPVKGWLHTVKGNSAMMGLGPAQALAHALEDACALVAGTAALRRNGGAALLVEGAGLLVDLVRGAGSGNGGDAAAAFVRQVRELEQRPAPTEEAPVERRRGDRRSHSADAAANVVRVDFRRLDTLLEVLGEGLVEHAAVADSFRRVTRRAGSLKELGDLDQVIVALGKTLKRLEAVVMGTRLLPLSSVFGRFPRLLRDLAQGEGKQVRLAITGGETALDKAVLDRIGEPLTHLLSNAVVHGIEEPAERRRLGKPEEAVVRLHAASGTGRVLIQLADDGRGLDEEKILARAQAQGIEVRGNDASQIRALIFQPGLTTADKVSQLAGRGLGLDVVASSVHALGGTIDVESRPGAGTTFTLDLPLTLAIVRSLIVEVDQERYAVPIAHVAETVRAAPEALHQINHRGVALWRGDLIQVADGGAILGTGSSPRPGRRFYIVLSSGGRRRGVLVDRLVGHQDVVVKGLDPSLGRPDVVSGTTILGDGKVACILDAVRILDQRIPA